MKIIFIMFILLISVGNISAYTYGDDGLGVFTVSCSDLIVPSGAGIELLYTNTPYVEDVYIDCYIESTLLFPPGMTFACCKHYWNNVIYYDGWWNYHSSSKLNNVIGDSFGEGDARSCTSGNCYLTASVTFIVSNTSNIHHTVSGTLACVDSVQLFIRNNNMEYIRISEECEDVDYSFNITENCTYKLQFSDDHEYIFECSENEICTYSACAYTTIYLKDYCGNNMMNTSADIYKSDGGVMSSYEFVGTFLRENPINLQVTDIGEGKMLDIYFDTDMGTYHTIDYCEEKTINVLHPVKYWSMSFGAFDIDTELPIEGMRVTMNQSCVIDPLHPLKQYLFTGVDGYGTFIGLSGEVIHVSQGHPDYLGEVGYTKFFINPFGDAFNTHYSIDTFFNKSSKESTPGNVTSGCNIWFEDQTGKRDNHINDTDTYVDLYYNNSNCSATLKFQRLYSTYWMSKMSFDIPALEAGYKRIYNVNFSDYDANYRGYMYASECDCNITRSLYVTNETIEEEQHYENLTAHCKFKHQIGGGQVDYRSPVEVLTYAYSNTSHTLLNINLTLYEQTTQIATKQCDWTDFAGAIPKWFYTWSPNVEYDIGKNYTVVMTGYNGLNLDADDVWTSNIRNNKLTVNVMDNHNTPVAYSTLFLQGWGSHALESETSFTVTGLQDEVYQYKATKSGYTSSGWASVNFTGEDQTVTCTLIEQETSSITGYKMKDDEIKAFFIPLMYLLMVMILIGGLMNAAKK